MKGDESDNKAAPGGLLAISTTVDSELLDFEEPLRGNIEAIPLGTVLVRASAQRATGTLRVARGRVKKVIYLIRGEPIFIDSNVRGESLGSYMLAHRVLDEARMAQALRHTREKKCNLGEALVQLGWVDSAQVDAGISAQVRVRLVDALRWADGTFSFAPGGDFADRVPRHPLELVPLVLSALSRLARDGDLEETFAARLDHQVRLTALGRGQLTTVLRVFGDGMLQIEGPGSELQVLLSRAVDRATLLAKLMALHTAELITLVAPPEGRGDSGEQLLPLQDLGPSALGSAPSLPISIEDGGTDFSDEDSGIIEIPSEWLPPARDEEGDEAPAGLEPLLSDPSALAQEEREQAEAARLEAEIAFREAQGRLRQHQPERALALLQRAVELDGEQADSHALLAWAQHLVAGRGAEGATRARPHLERAFELAPESARSHELAAQVEEDAGAVEVAVFHLRGALRYGPPRLDLFARLREQLLELGDVETLEAHYRRMVLRLRESDPQATIQLWIELAYLYKQALGRDDEARLALEVVERLAPSDPRLKAARAELTAVDLPWQEVAEGHRQRLLAHIEDADPLHGLFRLHGSAGREELARVAASILMARGEANDDERACVSARSREVPASSLAPDVLMVMRHPDDDPQLEELVAGLAEAMEQVLPFDAVAPGLVPAALHELPSRLGGVLHQACLRLDMRLPELMVAKAAIGVAPLPGTKPRLVISRQLFGEGVDAALLHFAIARALSCLAPGRREVFLRRGGELRMALSAALSLTHGASPPQQDPRQAALRDVLARSSRLDELEALLGLIFTAGESVNLSAWMRAVRRTSARVGAAAATDLLVALSALKSEADAFNDLVDFSLTARFAWIIERTRAHRAGPSSDSA